MPPAVEDQRKKSHLACPMEKFPDPDQAPCRPSIMQENEEEENSLPYLKWQLDQVTYQYEYSTELWGNRVSSILQKLQTKEDKNKVLQKELNKKKTQHDGVCEELGESREENQVMAWKLAGWEKNIIRQMEENNILKKNLSESREKNIEARGKIEKLNEKVESLQAAVDKSTREATKTHNAFELLKEETEAEIMFLNEENGRLKESLLKSEKLIKKLKEELVKTEKLLIKENSVGIAFVEKSLAQQKSVEEHAKKIQALKKDNANLAKMHHSLTEKNIQLVSSSKEYSHLMQSTRDLQEQVRRKTDLVVTMRANIKELHKKNTRLENEKQVYECKMEKANRELKGKNITLGRDVGYFNMRMKYYEQHRAKQKEELRKLQQQQRHFLCDIESCMLVIEDPKGLRQNVMKLRSNCGKHLKISDSKPPTKSESEIHSTKKLQNSQRALHITQRAKERTEQRLESLAVQCNKERGNLITIVNKQKEEIAELKIKLHNTTKPQQISSSWAKKKGVKHQNSQDKTMSKAR